MSANSLKLGDRTCFFDFPLVIVVTLTESNVALEADSDLNYRQGFSKLQYKVTRRRSLKSK